MRRMHILAKPDGTITGTIVAVTRGGCTDKALASLKQAIAVQANARQFARTDTDNARFRQLVGW